MNASFRSAALLTMLLLAGSPIQGQDAAGLLAEGQRAIQAGRTDHGFDLMVSAMQEARSARATTVYLQAANQIARLGLHRNVNPDVAFSLTREAAQAVAFNSRDTLLAALYFNLARFHRQAHQADDALHYFTQAASIYERGSGQSLQLANCFQGLADVYKYTVFNFQLAEEYYERALGIHEKNHSTDTITLYQIYYGLAATNRSQQDYDKAVAYGTVAVSLSRSLDIRRQEFANSMIANVYRDMGNSTDAIRSYREALRLNGTTGDATARAWHYQNLGETMLHDSLYQEALTYYNQAEALYRSGKARDERLFLHMLNRKARTYSEMRDDVRFQQAVEVVFAELKRTTRERSQEAGETYLMIANHYARDNKYYSAVDQCQLALVASIPQFNSLDTRDNPTTTMIGTSFFAGEVLAKKGEYLSRLFRATKRGTYLDQALRCLYLAEQLLSEQRNTLDTEVAKWAFLDTKYTVYESIIASLYEAWKEDRDDASLTEAYQFFERSKARSLMEALTAAEQARLIGTDDSLLRVHGRLKAEELTTENRIRDLAAKGSYPTEISRLREQLVAIDRRLQECTKAIEQKYPGYFAARYGQALNPLPDVQVMARDDRKVVLEYFWGAESVYGLGIAADTVMFQRIGSSDTVARVIERLVTHLHNERSGSSDGAFRSFVASAHTLYQMLVKPFEPIIGDANLQIIPDGKINVVPFDILLRQPTEKQTVDYRALDYLLKSRAVGYAYSTAMLRRDHRGPVSGPSLLAVGFTGGKPERAHDVMAIPMQEIEGAEKELDALLARFRSGKFLRDVDATESNFKQLSPQYDIIHLAIHGRGDRSNDFSASLFFRSSTDSIDDGVFHAYELYGLKLKALLAVLSACESGIGKDYRGEGMISMASAFTSAGCENTLMSLWKVNDQASIALMDDFYQQLLDGAPIDQALRQAKLNYLGRADELTAHPKTWAPLVAYGSLHPVFEGRSGRSFILVVLAVIAISGGYGFYYIRQRRRYRLGGSRSPL